MDYKNFNDYELLYTVQETEDDFNMLYEKYKPLLEKYVKKWTGIAISCGYEAGDIYQMVSLSFFEAVKRFDVNKNAKFITFLINFLNSSLKFHLRRYDNDSVYKIVSYNNPINEEDKEIDFCNYIPSTYDLNKSYDEYEVNEYIRSFLFDLPVYRATILELYLAGYSYSEIAILVEMNYKSVCNIIFRLKNKLRNIIKMNGYFEYFD